MLNKSKGQMYDFVDFTWNAIKGRCSHDCKYCYMKIFPQKSLHLAEKEFNTDLGSGNTIFVGSSTDMFEESVPKEWIVRVLNHCSKYPNNTYLFQSKNPARFKEFITLFPSDTILCTTIESNRDYPVSKAPSIKERIEAIKYMYNIGYGFETMITVEPLMDFDLYEFLELLTYSEATKINIGLDSKKSNLPEPTREKVDMLIVELNNFTKLKKKTNFGRLYE